MDLFLGAAYVVRSSTPSSLTACSFFFFSCLRDPTEVEKTDHGVALLLSLAQDSLSEMMPHFPYELAQCELDMSVFYTKDTTSGEVRVSLCRRELTRHSSSNFPRPLS